MGITQPMPNIDVDKLLDAIRNDYRSVALEPRKVYHFHTGRAALDRIGYDKTLYDTVPEESMASFAGTGYPFMLGPINQADVVVDVGSCAGIDSLIASTLLDAKERVIGIDMTSTMLDNARAGAAAMGAENVEFREGYVDNLPFAD
jgi:2-polyprenyl-3-methyl-5-hydroxy-6-metoxy-1,4-benzoquinol methylase